MCSGSCMLWINRNIPVHSPANVKSLTSNTAIHFHTTNMNVRTVYLPLAVVWIFMWAIPPCISGCVNVFTHLLLVVRVIEQVRVHLVELMRI